MSLSNGSGNSGGEPQRYVVTAPNQSMSARRRKNMNGSSFGYSNGPRDNRMNSYRNDNRMNSRGSGGSGDGPHNGSNYRNTGDYDGGQQQSCGPSLAVSERSGGHLHHQQGGSHQYHQYSQQHHHHHHHHQNKNNLDYDGMQTRSTRGGSSSGSHHHHMEHRSSGMHQHHQESTHLHGQHPPPQGFVGSVAGTGGHHSVPAQNDIVILTSQQDHHYKGGNVAPIAPYQGGVPQPIPGPAVGFFGYPNGQPPMGTLVLCHVPYGVNPASVIAAGVQTQVIGTGFLNPTLQFACAVPSQLIPSQPLIFQSPQHFATHPQPHFQPVISGPPPQIPPPGGTDEAGVLFDSTAILNPDANAFFPTMTSFSEEVEEEVDVQAGDVITSTIHNNVDEVELNLIDPKTELVKEEDYKDASQDKSGDEPSLVNISGNGSADFGSSNEAPSSLNPSTGLGVDG